MSKLIRLFNAQGEYRVEVMDGAYVEVMSGGGLRIAAASTRDGREIMIYPGASPVIIENQ